MYVSMATIERPAQQLMDVLGSSEVYVEGVSIATSDAGQRRIQMTAYGEEGGRVTLTIHRLCVTASHCGVEYEFPRGDKFAAVVAHTRELLCMRTAHA